MTQAPGVVTLLLHEWSQGDREALDRLLPIVYSELRRLARSRLRRERLDHTLESAALVHEACLRLMQQNRATWQSRAHFLSVVAGMMRRVLVDYARARQTSKRGNGLAPVSISEAPVGTNPPDLDLIGVDVALSRLQEFDPGKARIVELRFFSGLTVEETAEAVGLSPRTVMREWGIAKAWLLRELTLGTKTAPIRSRPVIGSSPGTERISETG